MLQIIIKHNPYSYLLMCQFCLMKLRLFVKCEGPDFTQDFYHRMQDFPPHTKDTSSTTDNRHIEDTSCQCEHCKAKFGNLPLLAEVVEKIDKRNSPDRGHETEPENLSLKRNSPPSEETDNRCSDVPENLSLKSFSATPASTGVIVNAGEVPTQVQRSETVTVPRNTPYRRSNSPKELSLSPKVKRVSSPVDDVCIPESVRDVSSPSTSTGRTESVIHRRVMNCEHCGKSFTHKGDLNKHLRKHTGEQPFECPVCQRKFAHTSNLARHLRVHSGDKPFHCDRCNKSFSRKDKLVMHQKTKLCINAAHSSTS